MSLPTRLFFCGLIVGGAMGLLLPGGLRAQTAPEPPLGKAADNRIYAQVLINQLKAENPDILAVGFHAVPPGTKVQAIIAYTQDKIGEADDPDEVELVKTGATLIVPSMKGTVKRYQVKMPLKDSSGRVMGMMVVSFRREDGIDEVAVLTRAVGMARKVATSVSSVEGLFKAAQL